MSGLRRSVLVLNGPNLNLLGSRDPDLYGRLSLADLEARLRARAAELDCDVEFRQSNSEGELVTWIQEAGTRHDAVIMNPGALAHYSYALAEAVVAARVRLFEVHITNVHAREEFRRRSVIAPAAVGVIAGLGVLGYELALEAAVKLDAPEG